MMTALLRNGVGWFCKILFIFIVQYVGTRRAALLDGKSIRQNAARRVPTFSGASFKYYSISFCRQLHISCKFQLVIHEIATTKSFIWQHVGL